MVPVDNPIFRTTMELLTGTPLTPGNMPEVMTCGDQLYPRLWGDLRAAQRSISIQLYYCEPGRMAEEMRALLFSWSVCKHVKSNAIVYARSVPNENGDWHGQTVGIGAGQMSRVDAARFGAMKAVLPLAGTVAASDAFFPFADGLEMVAGTGATAVIQPGGSVRDAEVIAAADKLGVAMVFTGVRHFRHG